MEVNKEVSRNSPNSTDKFQQIVERWFIYLYIYLYTVNSEAVLFAVINKAESVLTESEPESSQMDMLQKQT